MYVAAPSHRHREIQNEGASDGRRGRRATAGLRGGLLLLRAAAASAIPTISVEASITERRCMHVMMIKILEYDVRRSSMYQPVIPCPAGAVILERRGYASVSVPNGSIPRRPRRRPARRQLEEETSVAKSIQTDSFMDIGILLLSMVFPTH